MTRLNRSRIKYTPGLCGTSCTFFCRSVFSFFDAATRLQIYVRTRQVETGSPNRSISAEDSGHYHLWRRWRALSQRTWRLAARFGNHGPGAVSMNTRQQQTRPATGRWLQHESAKKRPRGFRGRLQFLLGKQFCLYGLVVVVVVVSSCLITAAGWEANTTLRTTTRSPTVE